MDKFYTPRHIATTIINHVSVKYPATIADFSAGNGDLLTAAASFWPTATIIANDYDKDTVCLLKDKFPKWKVSNCDFLNPKSRNSSKMLNSLVGKVSLALLNPPFSCKGGTKVSVLIEKEKITCSTSIAFLLNSLKYLSSNGEVIIILPRGTINSEKDEDAWRYLHTRFSVRVIKTYPRDTFSGCFPNTILVNIKIKPKDIDQELTDKFLTNDTRSPQVFKIVRGTQQLHKLRHTEVNPSPSSLPLLHTTKMAGGVIPICWVSDKGSARVFHPPAVLIPRVGEPKKNKICIYSEDRSAVISDCIFAVECPNIDYAIFLSEFIKCRWDEFTNLYGGTCAKYLTVANLNKIVSDAEAILEFDSALNIS